ncbi:MULTISPECIES: sensor histidine kinase [Streptomyces]|uniref:Sensor histidine kinase n=2 Tax=Streptomyces TaxID=1883 RepID=A0ABV9IGV7_9ACTN
MSYDPVDLALSESAGSGSPPFPSHLDIPAPRLARSILLVVLACFTVVIFLDVLAEHPSAYAVPWCAAGLVAAVVLQMRHSSPEATRWSPSRRAISLGLHALVTYLPLLVIKQEWGGMAGFLAGSVLLLVPGALSWVLFAAVVLSILVPGILLGLDTLDIVYLSVSTAVIGLIVYGLSRLSVLVTELIAAREDLTRLAVVRERLRFARDMHDLLGFNLSAITLKSELAHRLVAAQPERARTEISEILDISRRALTDVRGVARGYRRLSVATEAHHVQATLTAARINTEIDFRHGPLPPQADTVLAIVLREAGANVLRHSKATRCRITTTVISNVTDRIRLSVRNNGATARLSTPVAPRAVGGTGLASLTDRLSAMNGTLTSGITDDDDFELVVEVPSHADHRAVREWTATSQGTPMA